MIKEKELPKAVVSNKLITHKATDLTIMSYDKNVHKLIIPTDLTQAEISDIIVIITFRYHKNIIQISGELVEDKIEIILPNEIRSLSGEFYIEININLTDNRQITFARYHARVVKSDIDSVDLDDVPEFYFELFDDIVQKVSDKSEVAVAEIDAHEQSVSDKADTAITLVADASNSVTSAKQSAITSITQATSDVTDASTQFTVDLADTQSTIDAQVTQAQDSLQEVSDTLTAVNDKAATVNDTADAFMVDVADKSQLVDDKYQQFDDNVTQANGNLDAILGLVGNADVRLKNEIVNGDFLDGTKNWESINSNLTLSANQKELTVSINVVSASNAFRQKLGVMQSDDIFYNSFDFKPFRSHRPMILSKATMLDDFGVAEASVYNRVSATYKYRPDFIYWMLRVNGDLATDMIIGSKVYLKNMLLINLTQTFGQGNEPTKSEMDTLIDLLGGWFDGEITLTQKQQLNWLLKLIRQNALATTALGGTIL